MNYEDIKTQVDAGDSAATIATATVEWVNPDKVGGRATMSALIAADFKVNEIIATMRAVPIAAELLDTLVASGVNWADDLTLLVLGQIRDSGANAITQEVIDVLEALSKRPMLLSESLGQEPWTEADVQALIDAEARRATTETLNAEWTALLNDGGINAAIAAGDRVALIASLTSAVDSLEE